MILELLACAFFASSLAVSSLPYTGLSQKFVGIQNVSIYQRVGYCPMSLRGTGYPTADNGKIDIYFYFSTKLADITNSNYLYTNNYYFGDKSQLVVSDSKPTDYSYLSFLVYRVAQSDNTYTYFFELNECTFSNSSFSFCFVQRTYSTSTESYNYFPSISGSIDENGNCSEKGIQLYSKNHTETSTVSLQLVLSVSNISNVDTSLVYNQGYEKGKNDWYQKGKRDGEQIGYEKGHLDGINEDFTNNALINFFDLILSAPVKIIQNSLNFELFGINFANLAFGIITIAMIVFVISFFVGKGKS